MVARHVEREAHGRRERRLGAPGLAGPQALDVKAQAAAVREQALEHLGVVAVARDDQRAAAAQAGILSARLRERRAERLEALGGTDAQLG